METASVDLERENELTWFGTGWSDLRVTEFGFRLEGGGAHQSKTLMTAEIGHLIEVRSSGQSDFWRMVVEDNVLGKATASSRASVFRNLSSLYGLSTVPPLTRAFFKLASLDRMSRALLSLIVGLARDPLLRVSADAVIPAQVGLSVQWPTIGRRFSSAYPGRFSEKMVRSLSQNCASSWTQTGHLEGKRKNRMTANPTASVAALAALVATVCGFSGPSLLSSAWFRVLDLSPDAALDALRSAEARGLARVRAAGEVIEIAVRHQMAVTLGVPELEYV